MVVCKGRIRQSVPASVRTYLEALQAASRDLLPHLELDEWVVTRTDPFTRSGKNYSKTTRWSSGVGERIAWISFQAGPELAHCRIVVRGKHSAGSEIQPTVEDRNLVDIVMSLANRDLKQIDGMGDCGIAWMTRGLAERIVVEYLSSTLHVDEPLVVAILRSLHELSEASYEGKSISQGIVIKTKDRTSAGDEPRFPTVFDSRKIFRVLSDGFRTYWEVSGTGRLRRIRETPLDEQAGYDPFVPEWAIRISRAAGKSGLAFALTRQGDIVCIANRRLIASCRAGKWIVWSHEHLSETFSRLIRKQKVSRSRVGNTATALYETAVDVSFRKSGGLLLVIQSKGDFGKVTTRGHRIGWRKGKGAPVDDSLDTALGLVGSDARKYFKLPRRIRAELAAVDGAVIITSGGEVLSYGCVLQPKGGTRAALSPGEGSGSSAARNASNHGVSVKISADGTIKLFKDTDLVLEI